MSIIVKALLAFNMGSIVGMVEVTPIILKTRAYSR